MSDTVKEKVTMPTSDSLYQAMRIATTPEAAKYLVQQFEKKLKDSGLYAQTQGLLTSLKEFASTVEREHQSAFQVWNGDKSILLAKTPVDVQKINNQAGALKEYSNKEYSKIVINGELLFGFAVNEKSELRRGYSVDNNEIDVETIKKLDDGFNEWIVNKDMAVENGIVYEAVTAEKYINGGIKKVVIDYKKDSAGNPVKADPEKIVKALMDEKDGLKQFIQQANEIPRMETKQFAFPKEEVVQKAEPEKGAGMGAGG